MNSSGRANVKEDIGGWSVFPGMMLFMRAERPKLKLDQIFGPDLMPRPKRSVTGSLFIVTILTALGVVGYFYVTPKYLQWDLERQFLKAEEVEAAAEVAAGLVELGEDGTAAVVRMLGNERPELAQAAFQVLAARLDAVAKNEIVGDRWVKRVAAELKDQAGGWQPEARVLGCKLAQDIFAMFEALDQSAESGASNPLRWAPARLDCWAVLETYKVSEGRTAEVLMVASDDRSGLGVEAEGSALSREAVKGSERLASTTLAGASIGQVEDSRSVSQGFATGKNQVSNTDSVSDNVTAPRATSSGDAVTGVEGEKPVSAAKEGALVHIGPPQILEVVDAPMAHIEVVPRKGSLRPAPRSPVVNSQARARFGNDSELGEVTDSSESSTQIDQADEVKEHWQQQVQTIDARSPSQGLDIGKKQTLEVVSMLNDADPSIQSAAVRELEQRGFNSNEIDLASQLCRGSSQEQRKLLLNLPQMGLSNVTPWYIWMAQAEDRDVRKVAIEGLARVTDPQLEQFVRDLLANERDNELRELYRSILAQKGQ